MLRFKKIVYIVLGCIGLALGTVGVIFPVLPTVPFYMLAAFAFAKSSKRLHTWFVGTKLYKKNLESYVSGRGMTWGNKFRIMISVTVLMTIGFVVMLMKALYIPCAILGGVWVFHIIYFVFFVKNLKEKSRSRQKKRSKSKVYKIQGGMLILGAYRF